MPVIFTVDGDPRGKERPRFRGHAYTPAKTRQYEKAVKDAYIEKYGNFKYPDGTMLRMSICAFYKIPKSVSKANKLLMLNDVIRPTKKPDLDNIIKIIADALNGVAYKDDSAIIDIRCYKKYATEPKVLIQIEEVNPYGT